MIRIIGAGLSGLLAGNYFQDSTIFERVSQLPHNHSALLRFRSDAISRMTGIPFRKVIVRKSLLNDADEVINSPSIKDMNSYSKKVTGKISDRSIMDLAPGERWIAPDDFIEQLSENRNIAFDEEVTIIDKFDPIISTIPMENLMQMLNYKYKPEFVSKEIWTVNCILEDVDVYQTLYLPYDSDLPYRVTITGNRLTMEYMNEVEDCDEAHRDIDTITDILFGSVLWDDIVLAKQKYGKIVPIDEDIRQAFILWATDNFNVYSLGRFATWRNILLDDVAKDLQRIKGFMQMRSKYYRHRTIGE